MKILLYATNDGLILDLVDRIAERQIGCDVTICSAFEGMNKFLRGMHSFSAVVLVVENKEELLELLTIQKMFVNTKIILVLPNSSETLVGPALKLYPRYITEKGQGFKALTDVLMKIGSSSSRSVASYQPDHQRHSTGM